MHTLINEKHMKSYTFLNHVACLIDKKTFNEKFQTIGAIRSKAKRMIFLDLLKMEFDVEAAIEATELVFNITVKSKMTAHDVLRMAIDYRLLFDLWDGNIKKPTT